MKQHNRIGLGTFPLASAFHKISNSDAQKVVGSFLDQGGFYIDTAPMYGFGEVETLLGAVLQKYSREQYFIATKCGYIDVEGKTFQNIQKSGKYNDVLRECDRSLQRLKLNYIDLYFMHSPDPNTPIEETLQALEALQQQGKVRQLGVSNVNLSELKEYNRTHKINFIQNRFSLINRSIDQEFSDYLLKNNIKLVPYQVIDRGQLTSNLLTGISLENSDLRKGRADWLEEKITLIADWSKEKLNPIAQSLNLTLEQLALAWALQQPYMGFLIVGLTNQRYISINFQADQIQLSAETLKQIDQAYQELEKRVLHDYHLSLREFRGLNEKYY